MRDNRSSVSTTTAPLNVGTDIIHRLGTALVPYGLDLIQPLSLDWYQQAVAEAYRAPDFGKPNRLALIIGNTRALWPALGRAFAREPSLRTVRDPVDHYCAQTIEAQICALDLKVPWQMRLAPEPPPRRIAMQLLAHVAGLATRTASMLSVHPIFGPWIGLRALIVIDCEGPSGPPPVLLSPCDCGAHCEPLFQQACAELSERSSAQPEIAPARAEIESSWQRWLAVRDACPVGRSYRYGDEQCSYHYTHDRCYLPTASAS